MDHASAAGPRLADAAAEGLELPGAPFLLGSELLLISLGVLLRLFRRPPS